MNVLFITHKFYPDIGGIEVNSEILATAFQNAGHDVKLITWTRNIGEKSFPFEIIRHPNIFKVIAEHYKADVIFENNPSLRLSWPNIILNKPSVVALRTWINRMDGNIGWQDKFKKQLLKQSSAVIAVSDAIRRRCWPNAIVIGNPYRQNIFKILPEVSRNKDLVFVGRLVSDKGADLAIKALHVLSESFNAGSKGLSLTIIGSGPELHKLEEMVNELGLTGQVTFTGILGGNELVKQLNEHKFLLVPSVWEEPFGNVALEGLACGCLPIVSDGGGLPDAVGNAGLIVKRGDATALAEGIKQILNDPILEKQLRDAALAHLTNHFPDVVSKRYLDVIEKATIN